LPRRLHPLLSAADIVVNGLVIGTDDAADLAAYFRQTVILGSGSFVEVANGYADYARAMKRKLLRELSYAVSFNAPAPRPGVR
jgi:uncharacterized protein DUF1194